MTEQDQLLQEFVKAKFDVLLVEIRAMRNDLQTHMSANTKDHDEIFGRLRQCEQWQAECQGKQMGTSQISGKLIAAGLLLFTAVQAFAQVLVAYLMN